MLQVGKVNLNGSSRDPRHLNRDFLNRTFSGKRASLWVCSSFFALMAGGCGSEISTSSTELNKSIATIGVTSPAAKIQGTSSFHILGERSLVARLLGDITSLNWMNFFYGVSLAEMASDDQIVPFDQLQELIQSNLTANPSQVAAQIGSLAFTSYRADCYGPSWTDDATGSEYTRPEGDMGIVSANASATDTTACSAAQLNSLIAGAPQLANKLIALQSTLIAAGNAKGKLIPKKGGFVDVKLDMPTISGMNITQAIVYRLKDRNSDGNPVYQTSLKFTDANDRIGIADIYHTPLNEENTNFTGLIQGVLPRNSIHDGLSMVYQQIDGELVYALDIAGNSDTDNGFFFGENGRIDFTKAAFQQNGNRIIASFNTKTHASTMHYAWQAGPDDGHVRALAISIDAGTVGSLSGVAYSGFGDSITNLTDDVSTPWMTTMICNWSGPGYDHDDYVSYVQGQTIAQDAATGKFVAQTSKIDFAPTNFCDGSFTISNSNPSTYNGSRSVADYTTTLTTVNEMGSLATVSVPSYAVPTDAKF